jgi:hypothetical protein
MNHCRYGNCHKVELASKVNIARTANAAFGP